MCLKKMLYDQLQKEKARFSIKSIDVKHGELVKSVQYTAAAIKRHREFDLSITSILE